MCLLLLIGAVAVIPSYTQPVTKKIVTLKFKFPDIAWANVNGPEDGLIRYESASGNLKLGFSPVAVDEVNNRAVVKIYEITGGQEGEEISEIATLILQMGITQTLSDYPDISIGLFGITIGDVNSAADRNCCVRCADGGKICGCQVTSSCGNCCAQACCD